MHRYSAISAFGLILGVLLLSTGCVLPTNTEKEFSPRIHSITADPPEIGPGETTTLTCTATDANQDDLTYEWECDGDSGEFSNNATGSVVEWTAPETSQSYMIRVTVSDGHASNSNHISITVTSPPIAVFTVNPVMGDTETLFAFDAGGSWDHETETVDLEVRWDWEDDGIYDTNWTTAKTAEHQYDTPGTPEIRLQVRDEHGLTGEMTQVVVVN